jgi:hypothetical protein
MKNTTCTLEKIYFTLFKNTKWYFGN